MALRLRDAEPPTPSPPDLPAPGRRAAAPRRRPFRDNSRLILIGILLLVGALAALLTIANRSATYSPDFLVEVVLYALSVADVTMLAALVFVLARNIIKLIVERRRALPFARFRAKLVAVLLGHDAHPVGAGAHRRQRGDPHERRPLVQRADGRGAVVGQHDRQRLLPRPAEAGDRPRAAHRAACCPAS